MSISKQLMLLLSIAILGMLTIFGFAMTKMDQIYDETNYANVNSLPSVELLNDTMQNGYRLRLNLWEHISHAKPEEIDSAEKAVLKVKEAINTSLKEYEKLLSNDEDKAYLDKDKEALMKAFALLSKSCNFQKKTIKQKRQKC